MTTTKVTVSPLLCDHAARRVNACCGGHGGPDAPFRGIRWEAVLRRERANGCAVAWNCRFVGPSSPQPSPAQVGEGGWSAFVSMVSQWSDVAFEASRGDVVMGCCTSVQARATGVAQCAGETVAPKRPAAFHNSQRGGAGTRAERVGQPPFTRAARSGSVGTMFASIARTVNAPSLANPAGADNVANNNNRLPPSRGPTA